MQKQPTFIPRDQLVEGKQYYLYNDATYPATFVGRDETSVYFKSERSTIFAVEEEGPFEGCIAFFSSFIDDGFIEVDSE